MAYNVELRSLTDDDLLRRLSDVLTQSRRIESELVAHIAEVDARRLFAREASPSMFAYCIGRLHLSEAEAYLRIHVARATRKHPVLLAMLADGRLHLSGIALLAPHLTEQNRDDVLKRATHETKRRIHELVAELAPKPDVPARVRKLPTPRPKPARQTQLRPNDVAPSPASAPAAPCPKAPKPARVEPLAPARYQVTFTGSVELRDKLERLASLMPGTELASIIDVAITEKLERLEARRYGKTTKPRKRRNEVDTSAGKRGIPAPVKRTVWERDGGRCTYVGPSGEQCPERYNLEFHHEIAYARGGDRSPDNLCLMCPAHNAYLAELDYGKGVMERHRRSPDRVGEPRPSFSSVQTRSRRPLAGRRKLAREPLSRYQGFTDVM